MASQEIRFTLSAENTRFSIYHLDKIHAKELADNNFDIDDITGEVEMMAEIVYSNRGIHEIVYSGKISSVSCVIKIWQDGTDDLPIPKTYDLSGFDVQIDYPYNSETFGQFIPTDIDIDMVKKIVNIN